MSQLWRSSPPMAVCPRHLLARKAGRVLPTGKRAIASTRQERSVYPAVKQLDQPRRAAYRREAAIGALRRIAQFPQGPTLRLSDLLAPHAESRRDLLELSRPRRGSQSHLTNPALAGRQQREALVDFLAQRRGRRFGERQHRRVIGDPLRQRRPLLLGWGVGTRHLPLGRDTPELLPADSRPELWSPLRVPILSTPPVAPGTVMRLCQTAANQTGAESRTCRTAASEAG